MIKTNIDEYEYQEIYQNLNRIMEASGNTNFTVTRRIGGKINEFESLWKGDASDLYRKKMEKVCDDVYAVVGEINQAGADMLDCVNDIYVNQK